MLHKPFVSIFKTKNVPFFKSICFHACNKVIVFSVLTKAILEQFKKKKKVSVQPKQISKKTCFFCVLYFKTRTKLLFCSNRGRVRVRENPTFVHAQ